MESARSRPVALFVQFATAALAVFVLVQLWGAVASRGPEARVKELMPAIGAELVDRALSPAQLDYLLKRPMGASEPDLKLADYKPGQVIFLNFWATWCEPCVREMPSMLSLMRTLGDRRFTMLAVSYDESDAELLTFFRRFTGGLPREITVARDPAGDEPSNLRLSLGTQKLPETYIIRDGRVLARFVNERDWTDPAIVEYFQRLLEIAQ